MSQHLQPANDWPSEQPPIVGRAREQQLLLELLDATRAGHGRVVLIGGEAGVGKTTLVDWLAGEATVRGAIVLNGGCYDLTTTPPYGPWIEVADQVPGDPDGLQRPAVLRASKAMGTYTNPETLFDEARAFITNLSVNRSAMLVLEDVHWADAASLDLLRIVARDARRLSMLLVVTYRVDEVPPDHPLFPLLPLLVRESAVERLDLRRLTGADIGDLVSRRYELSEHDAERLVAYLLAQAEGNALYVTELLRTLEEQGVLTATSGGWLLGELGGRVVPRLIRQVIVGRAARLDETTRNLLAIASVIGQDVSLDVWSAVSGVTDEELLGAIEQAIAASFVAVAVDGAAVQFVHALIRAALYDDILPPRRRGWHRAIAETLAQAARPSPDAVAHHFQAANDPRAATWLIRAGEGAERAYAWTTAAARFEAALPWLEIDPSAQQLRGWVLLHLGRLLRYADPPRSGDYLDEALRVADTVGDRTLAALALVNAGMVRFFRWEIQRGTAEVRAGIAAQDTLTPADWAEAYRRQRALIDPIPADLDLEDPRGLEIAAVTSQQTGWFVLLVVHLAVHSEEAIALGESYATRLDAIDERALLRHTSTVEGASWIDTYFGLGEAYAIVGQVEAADRAYARAVELYRAVGHHAVVIQLVMSRGWLVQLPYQADDRDARLRWFAIGEASEQRAEGAFRAGWLPGMMRLPMLFLEGSWTKASEIARNMTHHQPSSIVTLAEVVLVTVAHAQGDAETAWEIIQRRFPNGPDSAFSATVAIYAFDLARLAAALALDGEDQATARDWLEALDRWLDESGRVLGRSESRLLWARSYALAGDWEQAAVEAHTALALASTPRQPLALLAAHRLLGEIAMRTGDLNEADRHLTESLNLAIACEAAYERALTLLAFADLHAVRGKAEDARRVAEDVREISRSLDAVPTMQKADALLTRLVTESLHPAYPAGLTAREVEVLRLVAQGLTDAEVAERLFLARRTVNTHLTSIYTKLNVNSRAAATRFAVENGLA